MDKESGFTHFDGDGNARMVDVSGKSESVRVALAAGSISMSRTVEGLLRTTNDEYSRGACASTSGTRLGNSTVMYRTSTWAGHWPGWMQPVYVQ